MKPISSLSFRDLTYLDTIDHCRSLTAAAHELYITQPALTKFLRRLEDDLGMELFRWNGNHMAPTPAGEKYLAFARKLLSEKEHFEQTMALEKWNQRILRIGIPFNRGELFVPALLAFEKEHPDVQVKLFERPFPDVEQELDNCEIDLAFTNSPPDTSNWVVQELWQEELFLYIPPVFPQPQYISKQDGQKRWIELSQLSEYRFILGCREQLLGRMAQQVFQENNFHPDRVFEIRNVSAELQLARAGYGVCFYALSPCRDSWSLSDEEVRNYLYTFGSRPYVNHFCAAYSQKLRDDTLIRNFISHMQIDG